MTWQSCVQIQLVSDVEVTGEAGTTLLDEKNKIKYSKIKPSCYLCSMNSVLRCYPDLKNQYYLFAWIYLSAYGRISRILRTDTPRIILYYRNKSHFEEIIRHAIAKYIIKINTRRKEAKQRSYKEYTWEVPEVREYNESTNHELPEVKNHALMPFIQLKSCSSPEKRFEEFLEEHNDCIDWWYKNGDEGKQHYSISYTGLDESLQLFYIDFVIRMKNGQIFLFDTKSQQSDMEAPNKHNSFVDYINSPSNENLHLLGGVIIEEGNNWYWAPFKIEDTKDPIANNWNAFIQITIKNKCYGKRIRSKIPALWNTQRRP
jgi:type III restriction enzyme